MVNIMENVKHNISDEDLIKDSQKLKKENRTILMEKLTQPCVAAIRNTKRDLFWETDLDILEKDFLHKGEDITDLPIHMSDVVPSQGSVLLANARKVKIDEWSIMEKIRLTIKSCML